MLMEGGTSHKTKLRYTCPIIFAINFIHRGYYTVVQRYEFYFQVAKQYFTNEHSE